MMGTVAQTVHQAAVSVQETGCCPKRGDVVCAMSVRVTREFGVDPPVLCSGMDVRLKWWSLGDETFKGPSHLSHTHTPTPPAPSFPCTSPATCVLDSAHERIRAAFSFRCPPSPPYIIHSVLLSPSTVPLHHLTLSTLSYCLHPVPLHHLTLSTLTVSIHCPPSPPYIIHCVLLSPSSPPSPPYIIHSYCLHPLPPFTTLIIHSYCRHPLPPFTTLHYPLLGCARSSCSCFFCS